jgi:hypothetical protein
MQLQGTSCFDSKVRENGASTLNPDDFCAMQHRLGRVNAEDSTSSGSQRAYGLGDSQRGEDDTFEPVLPPASR